MNKVVIDTESVRRLAQYTRGAIDQASMIRLELLRVEAQVNHGPGADAYGPLLGRIADLLTVLSEDHRALVQEVLAVEAEEGVAPTTTTSAPAPPVVSSGGGVAIAPFLGTFILRYLTGQVVPPPQPWNSTWVTAGGVIPVGAPTRQAGGGAPPLHEADFGSRWDGRPEGGLHPQGVEYEFEAGASADADADAGRDAQGNYYASFDAYEQAIVEARGRVDGTIGPIEYRGEAQFEAGERAEVHLWAKAGPDGVSAGGDASARVYASAEAEGEINLPGVAGVEGNAGASSSSEAYAGAQGQVDGKGASGGYKAGAYSGGEVNAGYSGHVGAADGSYNARVGTGIGVESSGGFSLSLDDIGFDFSGTLGLGLSLGIDLSLHFNPEEFVGDVVDFGEGVVKLASGEDPWESSDASDRPAAPEASRPVDEVPPENITFDEHGRLRRT